MTRPAHARATRGRRRAEGTGPRRRTGAVAVIACAALVLGLIAGRAALRPGPVRAVDAAHLSAADVSAADSTTATSATATSTTSTPAPATTTTTAPGSTTTTTTPDNPTVPAPAGYAAQLTGLYGEIYDSATAVQVPGQSQEVMTPGSFDSQVDGLSQADLSMLYTATSNIPNFDSLTTTFEHADVVAVRARKILKLDKPDLTRGTAAAQKTGATVRPTINSLGLASQLVVPTALTNFTPSQVPVIYPAASCPDGAPGIDYGETAIFSLQVAADVIAEAVAVIPDGLSTAFGNVTIPNVARIIIAAIQLGVVITHDTFAYLQAVSNDCAGNYLAALAGNTDNTAFQTFTELTQVAGTANEIDTNVANLTNQDTSEFDQNLTLLIQESLAAPTSAVPMAAMELPASSGGYLDATPVGVNEVVTATIKAMQATDQPLSATATRDETLAEQAFASDQYKLAFDYYRLAYQAAAS